MLKLTVEIQFVDCSLHCGQMVGRAVMSNSSFNVQFVKNEGSGYSQHRNKIEKSANEKLLPELSGKIS